jgi:PAS domain S-box-containing protein
MRNRATLCSVLADVKRMRRSRLVRGAVAVGITALGMVAHADPVARTSFRSFGVESGLQNLSINQVSQAPDGLIWVATEDGLYRYNGERFQRFGIPDGLPSNDIIDLLPTSEGLWIGTGAGVAYLPGGRNARFRIPLGNPQVAVNALALDAAGTLWLATAEGVLHEQVGGFALAPGWPGGPSSTVWVGPDGAIIAGRGNDAVILPPHGHWIERDEDHGLGREEITAVARTADGITWLRSARYLWACDDALAACKDASSELPDVSELGYMRVDRAGTLWVTTRTGLAHRTKAASWELLGGSRGVPARSILGVFEDREGSLWLIADELYQLLGRGLWSSYSGPTFPEDTVWSIMRARDGALWLGGNRGVIHALPDDAGWALFPGTQDSTIKALVETPQHVIYAADAALLRLDPVAGTSVRLGPPRDLAGEAMLTVAYQPGTVWAAPGQGGLLRMTEAGAVWAREVVTGGSAHELYSQLVVDRDGRLWAAGNEGLSVREGKTWHRFTHSDGLASTSTAYLVVRASGEICVAYTQGFGITCFRYDGHLRDLHHLTHATGLANDKIYLLGEDALGRLYAGMGIGIDVIDGATIEHFSTASGLAGNDCAATAFLADPSGTVMFGTTRGLERFDARHYRGPPPAPAPVILGASFDGTPATAGATLSSPTTGRSSLTIEFATPSFINSTQVEQQIRLQPLEHEWRTTTVGEARYAQLPAGEYAFELRSRIAPGSFGPVEHLAFTVPPAWWQRTWFRAVLVLALLGVVAVLIRWLAKVSTARAGRRIVERSEMSFRAMIEQSPDVVLVHRDLRLIYVNRRAVTYLGYAGPEALRGQHVRTIVHPDDFATIEQRVQGLLATGTSLQPAEFRMERADSSTVVVEATSIIVDFAGEPAVLTIARDRTERRSLEARLILADRMASIGTLAAGIAHEINNPLSYVKTNLALVAEELTGTGASATMQLAVADALEGAERVQKIVGGLKVFARADHQERSVIDVPRALELALRITTNELRHRGRITTEYGPLPLLIGDESRLSQVLINLLVNASQALPEGAIERNEIRVRTRTDELGRGIIEIEDNGCGMPPEVLKRAFDPFFTTKAVGEGTGLGLSICLGIIESLGGTLTAESKVDVGSTFRISLPASTAVEARAPAAEVAAEAAEAAVAAPAPGAPATSTRSRILLVDDDDRVRDSLGRMLRRQDDVVLAKSGDEALGVLAGDASFDAIVSDLMMPGMTGMELHAEVARRFPRLATRMIFMSGGAFTAEARDFVERLGELCLEKPFEIAQLRARLRSLG